MATSTQVMITDKNQSLNALLMSVRSITNKIRKQMNLTLALLLKILHLNLNSLLESNLLLSTKKTSNPTSYSALRALAQTTHIKGISLFK